jgi:hypothetical protein
LFRIIGYDVYTDVCIAVYDPYLDYNKNNFAPPKFDIVNKLSTIDIYGDNYSNIGQEIQIIGNLGLYDNQSLLKGEIIDNDYFGNFRNNFILSYPNTILANVNI